MKLFFDTEFTGLHKNTTLISIGIVSEDGRTFYCELNDYNESQVNDWIRENVIAKLKFRRPEKNEDEPFATTRHESNPVPNNLYNGYSVEFRGTMADLRYQLNTWLFQFKETCYFWSDCLSYDWVLFNHIFGSAFDIPENVYYIPFDICTMFEMIGIDPDISREQFVNIVNRDEKHNALFDAKVIQDCYIRLSRYSRFAGWVSIQNIEKSKTTDLDIDVLSEKILKDKANFNTIMQGSVSEDLSVKGEMHLNKQIVEYDLNHIKIVNGPMIAESGNQYYGIPKVERVDTSDESNDAPGEFGTMNFNSQSNV